MLFARDPPPSAPHARGPRAKNCLSSCLSSLHLRRSWSRLATRTASGTLSKSTGIGWRLFFLSLLWRSGASKRKEVAEIDVPSDVLEKLRLMLLNKNAGSLSFYPAVLVQLST